MFIDTTMKINVTILLHSEKFQGNIIVSIFINGGNVSETLAGLSIISQKLFEKKQDMPAPEFMAFAPH